jgi:hypothetical protein
MQRASLVSLSFSLAAGLRQMPGSAFLCGGGTRGFQKIRENRVFLTYQGRAIFADPDGATGNHFVHFFFSDGLGRVFIIKLSNSAAAATKPWLSFYTC